MTGARDANALAIQVLASAGGAVDTLIALAQEEDSGTSGASNARRASLAVLRDLDLSLLERNVLSDLLKLGKGDKAERSAADLERELDNVRERLAEWVLSREVAPQESNASPPAHLTLHLRRLRALLHLVDGDLGSEDGPRANRNRSRWAKVVGALLRRFDSGPPQRASAARFLPLFHARSMRWCALMRSTPPTCFCSLQIRSVEPSRFRDARRSIDGSGSHSRLFTRYAAFFWWLARRPVARFVKYATA